MALIRKIWPLPIGIIFEILISNLSLSGPNRLHLLTFIMLATLVGIFAIQDKSNWSGAFYGVLEGVLTGFLVFTFFVTKDPVFWGVISITASGSFGAIIGGSYVMETKKEI